MIFSHVILSNLKCLKKSSSTPYIFCRVLDIRVPKLVEAENKVLLVVAESRMCYNADRLWFCRSLFCMERGGLRMARKSRKHQTVALPHPHSETAGYIRLSVTGKGGDDSIENQKKIIEAWGQENQHPILRWYIDAGWSGRTFDRPSFRS